MRKRIVIATLAMLAGLGATSGVRAAEDIKMGELIEYPHAGIALAVPQEFKFYAPTNPSQIVQAMETEKDTPVRSVVLSAFAAAPGDTAELVAEKISRDLSNDLSFSDLNELNRTTMPIAGVTGQARLLSYTFRGHKYFAAQLCFVRDLTSPKICMAYVLNVEVQATHQHQLTAIFGAVANLIKPIALQQAATLPVEKLGQPMEDARYGYSVRLPHGWFLTPLKQGIFLAQGDFVLGKPIPAVQIVVQEVPPLTTGREYAQKYVEMERQDAQNTQLAVKTVSEGVKQLAGLEGYQIVLAESLANPAPGQEGTKPVTVVLRAACQSVDQNRSKCFGMRLVHYGADPKAAEAMMDKITSGYVLLAPATATGPATAPSAPPGDPKGETEK